MTPNKYAATICSLCRNELDINHGTTFLPLSRPGRQLLPFVETLRLVSDAICYSCNHEAMQRFEEIHKRHNHLLDDGTINPQYTHAMEQYAKSYRDRVHNALITSENNGGNVGGAQHPFFQRRTTTAAVMRSHTFSSGGVSMNTATPQRQPHNNSSANTSLNTSQGALQGVRYVNGVSPVKHVSPTRSPIRHPTNAAKHRISMTGGIAEPTLSPVVVKSPSSHHKRRPRTRSDTSHAFGSHFHAHGVHPNHRSSLVHNSNNHVIRDLTEGLLADAAGHPTQTNHVSHLGPTNPTEHTSHSQLALNSSQSAVQSLALQPYNPTIISSTGHPYVYTNPHALQTAQHSVAESHRALIRAERDLESVREELNRTRSELDDVRKNLERERDDKTRSMTSLQSQAEKTQEEMGRRHRELLDQIAVLKSLNDAATEERTHVLEEHEQRKQHYNNLIDFERNEKTRLLDEYRGQTEALLSDQGKEIESLRITLEAALMREKTMVQELHASQTRTAELEAAQLRWETKNVDERSSYHKKVMDCESRHIREMDTLRTDCERRERDLRGALERITATKEQLQEQLRHTTAQIESERAHQVSEREESRRKHEKEIDAVLRELRDAKAWRERSEEQSRAEVDKVTRESEELVVSLRRELDHIRREKQENYEQTRIAKETMMNEHQARLQHLHTSIDNLRKELSEERQSRKDAESMRQTLNVKLDQAHVEIARLHSENERTQLDSRQTERQLSTDHLNLVENLKGQIRTLEGEHLHARSQVKKLEDEVRHWVNQAENLREELVSEQLGARTQAEEARRNYYHIAEQLEENRSSSAKAIEAAQARRIEVEAELARCQSLNEELHAKLSLSSKNLVAERRRVENLTDELCKANAMLDREKGAHQKTLNIVMEKESELEDLIRAKEDALRDRAVARREQDVLREQHERDLERQTEAHNSKMLDCELKSEGFKQEIIALEEQIRAREGTIHDLAKTIESHRNTISKLQVTLNSQNATSRRQYELTENHFSEEIARMEAILQTLKEDLNKSNQARYALQREHAERLREHERQVLALQESCEAERAARVRITEEVRSAEHNQTEQQAMIRMLTTRIQSREEELRKAETELQNTQTKYQECTMHVGRKESQIHQLMARIRALELRVPATPGKLLH